MFATCNPCMVKTLVAHSAGFAASISTFNVLRDGAGCGSDREGLQLALALP